MEVWRRLTDRYSRTIRQKSVMSLVAIMGMQLPDDNTLAGQLRQVRIRTRPLREGDWGAYFRLDDVRHYAHSMLRRGGGRSTCAHGFPRLPIANFFKERSRPPCHPQRANPPDSPIHVCRSFRSVHRVIHHLGHLVGNPIHPSTFRGYDPTLKRLISDIFVSLFFCVSMLLERPS